MLHRRTFIKAKYIERRYITRATPLSSSRLASVCSATTSRLDLNISRESSCPFDEDDDVEEDCYVGEVDDDAALEISEVPDLASGTTLRLPVCGNPFATSDEEADEEANPGDLLKRQIEQVAQPGLLQKNNTCSDYKGKERKSKRTKADVTEEIRFLRNDLLRAVQDANLALLLQVYAERCDLMKPFPVEIHRLGNTALHIAVECTLQPINSLFNVYPANNLPSAIHATDARVNSRITPLSENWLRQDSNICQERGQPVMKSSSLGDLIDDDSTDEKVSNEGETGLAITITRRRRLLSQSHLTIVEFILQNTPLNQIQQTNLRGDTVLHHAARHGCVEALKLILQAGGLPTPMLSFTNHNRQTALQLAEMMLSRLTSPSISDAKQRRVHHMKDSSPISQSSRGVHVPPSNRESFASDKNTLTLTYKGVNPFDESSPGVNDGFFSGSAANKDFEAELLDEMDRDVGTMLSVQGEEGEINGDADDYRACVGLLRLAECLMATSTSLVNPSHSSRGLSTSVATSSPNFFLGVTSLPLRADLLLSTFTHGSAVSSTSGVSSGSGLSLNPGISQQFRQALFEAVDRLDGVDWGLNTAPGTPFGINSIRGQKSIVPQVHNYVPATSSVINLGTAGITRQNETVMPASSMTSYKRSEASSNQIHATGVSDNTMRRRLLAKGNSVAIDWRESRRKFAEGLGIRTTRNKASDHAIQQHHHNQNQFSHHLQLLQQQMANKTENSLGKQVSPLSLCDSSTSNHASPAFSSGLITLPRKKGPAPRPPKASPNTGNGTFQAPSDKHSPGHTSLDADSSGLGFDERSSSAGPISRLFSSQRISRRSDLGLGIGVDLDFKLGFDFSFSNSLSDSQNNNEREASSLASCPPHFRTLVSPNRHGTQLSNYLVRALTSSHHSKSNVSGVDDVGRADECANSGDRTKFLDHFRFSTLIQTTNNTIKDDLQLMDPCSSGPIVSRGSFTNSSFDDQSDTAGHIDVLLDVLDEASYKITSDGTQNTISFASSDPCTFSNGTLKGSVPSSVVTPDQQVSFSPLRPEELGDPVNDMSKSILSRQPSPEDIASSSHKDSLQILQPNYIDQSSKMCLNGKDDSKLTCSSGSQNGVKTSLFNSNSSAGRPYSPSLHQSPPPLKSKPQLNTILVNPTVSLLSSNRPAKESIVCGARGTAPLAKVEEDRHSMPKELNPPLDEISPIPATMAEVCSFGRQVCSEEVPLKREKLTEALENVETVAGQRHCCSNGDFALPIGRLVQGLYDCEAEQPDELTFGRGEMIRVTRCPDPEWWEGHIESDLTRHGLFPVPYIKLLSNEPSSPDSAW